MAKIVIVKKRNGELIQPAETKEEIKAIKNIAPDLFTPKERTTVQGPDFTAVVDRKDAKIEVKNENREPCLPYGMRGFFFGG